MASTLPISILADREPTPHLEKRRIDLGTGLPSLPVAWEDITHLAQQLDAAHCLGIIALAVLPDPVLLRLAPEVSRDLRLTITRRIESARPLSCVDVIS